MAHLPIGLQSLVIQCLAALLALVLNGLLQTVFDLQPGLWQLAMAQGGIAAALSRVWRQPPWWLALHACFLPAVLLARTANLPAGFYLAAFLLLLMFYWSTFRSRVPLYLSDRRAWQAVTPLLPESGEFRFIDLGSGFGDLPLYLEPRFPDGRFYGTEVAPAPWLVSWMRGRFRGSRVRFLRRDYAALDLADFDVVFAFLSPAAMPALWRQAVSQMRRGSLFVSLSFKVGEREPDRVLALAQGARHTLYVWQM